MVISLYPNSTGGVILYLRAKQANPYCRNSILCRYPLFRHLETNQGLKDVPEMADFGSTFVKSVYMNWKRGEKMLDDIEEG